jgi:hypothetical protein
VGLLEFQHLLIIDGGIIVVTHQVHLQVYICL